MAAPTMYFGKIEAWLIMKLLFLLGKGAVEIHGEMKEVLKDGCPSYSTEKIWVSRFQTGHFEVTDEPQSGQPALATKKEALEISCERVGHIIHNILDMRKLSAKCLNSDQKCIRMTSKVNLDWFAVREADFMAHLVTMDETWLHHYDPQTKPN
eukprot:XP_014782683.1 PREDICTED: uncharacterized protein LOC106878094 [Octopus bimaculoides]